VTTLSFMVVRGGRIASLAGVGKSKGGKKGRKRKLTNFWVLITNYGGRRVGEERVVSS